jgi:hypothetical protein
VAWASLVKKVERLGLGGMGGLGELLQLQAIVCISGSAAVGQSPPPSSLHRRRLLLHEIGSTRWDSGGLRGSAWSELGRRREENDGPGERPL